MIDEAGLQVVAIDWNVGKEEVQWNHVLHVFSLLLSVRVAFTGILRVIFGLSYCSIQKYPPKVHVYDQPIKKVSDTRLSKQVFTTSLRAVSGITRDDKLLTALPFASFRPMGN
jgi:hypothetical protein